MARRLNFAKVTGLKLIANTNRPDAATTRRKRTADVVAIQITLLTPDADIFHKAAFLTLDAKSGLRAGDALHLTSALQANGKRMATLDDVFARNAKQK